MRYNDSAIARFFSTSVFTEMSRLGKSSLLMRLAYESGLLDICDLDNKVEDLLTLGFETLKKNKYRNEYIYKAALTEKILLGRHSLQTASMLQEFRVGSSKADIAILNGTATAYEIKSERDSLARLSRQVCEYRTVFPKVYVIAGENHIKAVMNSVSSDVGVMKLSNRHQISVLREADNLPGRVSSSAIFDSVRINEAVKILNFFDKKPSYKNNTERYGVVREEFNKLKPEQAHFGMVKVLKETRSLLPLSDVLSGVPVCLQSVALSTQIRKRDKPTLFEAINTSISVAKSWIN